MLVGYRMKSGREFQAIEPVTDNVRWIWYFAGSQKGHLTIKLAIYYPQGSPLENMVDLCVTQEKANYIFFNQTHYSILSYHEHYLFLLYVLEKQLYKL